MIFPYWLYLLICYITWPVRCLMVWWPERNLKFAIRLLFPTSFKYHYVLAHSEIETGKFTSNLYRNHANAFGMGYGVGNQRFSKPYSSPMVGEPSNRASYTNVYKSVYDYYHRAYYRFPSVGQAFNVPYDYWQADSSLNKTYTDRVSLALAASGYMLAPPYGHASTIRSHQADNKADLGNWWYNIVGTVFMLVFLCYLCWRNRRYVRFPKLWK